MGRGKNLEIVEAGLPKLDHAGMVATEQEGAIMGPGHGANGRVMGLHNGFKVVGVAIPQGKFARGGTRHQSLGIGGPTHHINRTPLFVQTNMDKLCTQRIQRILTIGNGGQQLKIKILHFTLMTWEGEGRRVAQGSTGFR